MRQTLDGVRSSVRGDRAYLRSVDAVAASGARETIQSLGYHASRAAGAALGSRADRLPAILRRICSLEGRSGYEAHEPATAIKTPVA